MLAFCQKVAVNYLKPVNSTILHVFIMNKKFVKVVVEFNEDGRKTPRKIYWNDDMFYNIDKVLSVKNRPSIKVGGMGERYEIKINGVVTFLFYEEGKWFVEEK